MFDVKGHRTWISLINHSNNKSNIGVARGPCFPKFCISSHFALWEATSRTTILLLAWSQTFCPPKTVGLATPLKVNTLIWKQTSFCWVFFQQITTYLPPAPSRIITNNTTSWFYYQLQHNISNTIKRCRYLSVGTTTRTIEFFSVCWLDIVNADWRA